MRKTLFFIHRIILTLGVLIALTPCGLCQKGMSEASKTCSMTHMSPKMDCCHKAKSHSPLCQIMDQSSTVVSASVNAAVIPVVSAVISAPSMLMVAVVPSAVSSSSSPPRGLLALRI